MRCRSCLIWHRWHKLKIHDISLSSVKHIPIFISASCADFLEMIRFFITVTYSLSTSPYNWTIPLTFPGWNAISNNSWNILFIFNNVRSRRKGVFFLLFVLHCIVLTLLMFDLMTANEIRNAVQSLLAEERTATRHKHVKKLSKREAPLSDFI